jgi:hypothetical protein
MSRLLPLLLLLLAAATASAQDLSSIPKLKPGLWEMTTASDRAATKDRAPQASSLCLDESVQKQMLEFSQGMMKGMCSKHELKVNGSTITGESVCQFGGSTMKSSSVMKFTGNTAYRTEANSTYEPPLMGMSQSRTVIEAKHVGGCPAGMQPGDLRMSNGQTVNLKQLSERPPQMPAQVPPPPARKGS